MNESISESPKTNPTKRNMKNIALPILPLSNNNTSSNYNIESNTGNNNINEIDYSSSNVNQGENIKQLLQKVKDSSDNNTSDVFLTDKIKEIKPLSSPVVLNNLIINIKENPTVPKSINPLFFIINGERPVDKEKCMNFNVNPHLKKNSHLTTSNSEKEEKKEDNIMLKIERESEKLHEMNMYNKQHHNSLKATTFEDIFNKSDADRIKIKTDIKKLIFNNNKNSFEDNVKLIKDLTKNEMINRSSGKGMFLFNTNFRNDQHLYRYYKNKQLEKERNNRDLMSINLRKNNFLEVKKFDRSAEVFFARTFMKMTYEDYKIIQNEKQKQKKLHKMVNTKYQKMYEKKPINLVKYNDSILNKVRDYRVAQSLKKAEYYDNNNN